MKKGLKSYILYINIQFQVNINLLIFLRLFVSYILFYIFLYNNE